MGKAVQRCIFFWPVKRKPMSLALAWAGAGLALGWAGAGLDWRWAGLALGLGSNWPTNPQPGRPVATQRLPAPIHEPKIIQSTRYAPPPKSLPSFTNEPPECLPISAYKIGPLSLLYRYHPEIARRHVPSSFPKELVIICPDAPPKTACPHLPGSSFQKAGPAATNK